MSWSLFHRKKRYDFLDPDEILADSTSALNPASHTEGKIERPLGRNSSWFFLILTVLTLSYLIFRAYGLQIQGGNVFFAKSQENRFLVRLTFPPRGIINDHYGSSLVENIPSFGLVFDKAEFLKKGGSVPMILEKLGGILGQPQEYFFDLGFPANDDVGLLPPRIFLAQNITREEVLLVAVRLDDLPGVEVFESYRRKYKDPYAFSHVLGFVGRPSKEDLVSHPELASLATIGKSGLELFDEEFLRGQEGKKIVEIDSKGNETRFKLAIEPKVGSSIKLSLDGELQKVAYAALERHIGGRNGATVVALDPRSGAVRALVSYPGFDSNSFGYSLGQKDFEKVLNDPRKPFFNRAVSGEFPSGSTIKPVIAAAALSEKIIDPEKKIYDPGYIDIPNPYRPGESTRFLDWRPQGMINMYDALAYSANVYFYIIGGGFKDQPGLGIEKIKKYAQEFGFGSRLGIDIPGEKPGFIPGPESKKISEPSDPVWRTGDTYNVSIGQGGVKVTPLQLASMTSIIANDGTLYKPRLLEAVLDGDGKADQEFLPEKLREGIVLREILEKVKQGMRQAVTGGTARILNGLPVEVAAKTGTAESGSARPHAWITAFAPYRNPELVLTVMVEHAGEGATVAGPIANEIWAWYFANRRLGGETPSP